MVGRLIYLLIYKTMKCPVCKDVTLLMSQKNWIEIDYCPECRGVWLDRWELEKLMNAEKEYNSTYEESYSRNNHEKHHHDKGFWIFHDDDWYHNSHHNNNSYNHWHWHHPHKKKSIFEAFDIFD